MTGRTDFVLTLLLVVQFRERQAVRLCLKFLRQTNNMDVFELLQKRTAVALEDPLLTELHELVVTRHAQRLVATLGDVSFAQLKNLFP